MPKKKKKGVFSPVTAADNIRYRGYMTAVKTSTTKQQPLSKSAWIQAGRPKGT